MIDLHLHSFVSDGDLSPSEIVRKAKQNGISTLSLTDHDSISGIAEAQLACKQLGIRFIPGVELEAATDISRSRYIHILGYNFNNSNILNEYLTKLREERIYIIMEYVKVLRTLGIYTSYEEISSITSGLHITAYHIPMFLHQNGYYESFSQAKKDFINPSGKYYIPRNFYDVDFIINLILKAGGIPVLAHPCRLPQKNEALDSYVAELTSKGLLGIETFYPEQCNEDVIFYKSLAQKYGLLQTAGSDWHSEKSQIKMGFEFSNEEAIVKSLLNCKRD